jgi:hypothetical protein
MKLDGAVLNGLALAVSALSGGGLVGWMQIRRQIKLDALNANEVAGSNQFDFVKEWSNQFEARELAWKHELEGREKLAREQMAAREREWFQRFESQNKVMMDLKSELGILTGRFLQSAEQNVVKDTKIASLESENAGLRKEMSNMTATAVQLAAVERGTTK